MTLFGPGIPKGITEKELLYIRGDLKAGPLDTHFTDKELDDVMDLLAMAMDSDSYADRVNHVKQADASEAATIEARMKNELTPAKQVHLKQVLDKYISINKVGGLFN